MAYEAPKEIYDWLDKNEEVTDLNSLREQVKYLRWTARDFRQYLEVVTSKLHRRIWWWFGGYCFTKVGRWYSDESLAFRIWFWIGKNIVHLT